MTSFSLVSRSSAYLFTVEWCFSKSLILPFLITGSTVERHEGYMVLERSFTVRLTNNSVSNGSRKVLEALR